MIDDLQEDGIRVKTLSLMSDTANETIFGWNGSQQMKAPSFYYGQHANKGNSQNPNMMAFYFRGLPKKQDWIRVDCVRHWEALPRLQIKDFVGLKRPVHNQKTLDHVQKATHTTNLHSHDGETGDQYKQMVAPVAHLIPDKVEVVKGEPTPDRWAEWTGDLLGLGLGAAVSFAGVPEAAGLAATAGQALGSAGYNYMYGPKALTY